MPLKVCTVAGRLTAYWNRSPAYRRARFTLESKINEMALSSASDIYNHTLKCPSEPLSCLYFTVQLAM